MSYGPLTRQRSVVATNTGTTTPVRDRFRLLWAHVEYTSDGTAGNRRVDLLVLDEDNNTIWDSRAAVNQAASLTRHYSYLPGGTRETSFSGGNDLYITIPTDLILLPGDKIKVYDSNGVSASDNFVLVYELEEV